MKTGAALGAASLLPLSTTPAAAIASDDFGLGEIGWQDVPIGDAKPGVMQAAGKRDGAPYYEIYLEEGEHKHHPDIPTTTVWGYRGSEDDTVHYPGKTIEASVNHRVKVNFVNNLPTDHLLTVDPRVHGASLADYEDQYPDWAEQFDSPDDFPEVRSVTHSHGLHVESASDGLPLQWSSSIQGGDQIRGPGFQTEVYDYTNRQAPATLWYHDHALGITRLNVYAGLAGFYLLRGAEERRLGLPDGDQEIPLVFQDRAFNEDGSYKYPDEFEPEVSGDVSVVNGLAWPKFEVEPQQYRFRILNGSNGRFFNVRLGNEDGGGVPTIYQVGTDLGYLDETVPIGPNETTTSLLLGPAERADVVVDFSDHAGETLTVTNDADFPFEGPAANGDANGAGLPELAQFEVASGEGAEPVVDPTALKLPGPEHFPEQSTVNTREMTLVSPPSNAEDYELDTHLLNDRPFDDPIQTKPKLGTTEVWELKNNTPDAHPIHLHLVDFQVIGRGPDGTADPAPNELGNKDTVKVYAGETVRIISRFGNFTGRYVWHCHILEHEDQEMMRPYEVIQGNE